MCNPFLIEIMRLIQKTFLFLYLLFCLGCSLSEHSHQGIEVWHWMTDRQEAFEVLAKQYQDQTGISVHFKLITPSFLYTQSIQQAMMKKNLPDVYGVLHRKDVFADLIREGWILNLTDFFQADDALWEKSFFTRALEMNRFGSDNAYGIEAGIYGVPLDMGGVQLLYNRRLLQEAGILELPVTFDEWLLIADMLREKGQKPFVAGFKDVWLLECLALNYAFHLMGEQKVMDTFAGRIDYTDSDWIQVFHIFETLKDQGILTADMLQKDNASAEQDFAYEKAVFTFNGTWSLNVYHQLNHQLNFGVMPLPIVDANRSMVSWGGTETSFVVNARSSYAHQSILFLKWLTEREQQTFLSAQLDILPANRGAIVNLSDPLKSFAESLSMSTHPHLWENTEDVSVQEAFLQGLKDLIMGTFSSKEVAERIQKIKIQQKLKNKK